MFVLVSESKDGRKVRFAQLGAMVRSNRRRGVDRSRRGRGSGRKKVPRETEKGKDTPTDSG